MAQKLFVGNLSWNVTDDQLQQFFAQAGTVVSANIVRDKFSGRSRGYGFVEMDSEESAQKAKDTLNGQQLDDRAISVNDARPQEDRGTGAPQSQPAAPADDAAAPPADEPEEAEEEAPENLPETPAEDPAAAGEEAPAKPAEEE